MGTVVFDFDSTLVPVESLELVLAAVIGNDAERIAEIAALTDRGMNGDIGFRESLEQRLAIARPTRAGVVAMGEQLAAQFTDGAADLVAHLHERGHEVWIVSGGFRDLLLPPGRALGIPDDRVQGVTGEWTEAGEFVGLADTGFADSKIVGVERLPVRWSRPAVGVGDGMTDHALFAAGLVDHFVTYAEHARRDAVLATGCPQAASMAAVSELLETML